LPKETLGEGGPYRCHHTAHIYENRMFVFGGKDLEGKDQNEVWHLTFDTKSWEKSKVFGNTPKPRNRHSSVITNEGKIYIFGGISNDSGYLNDLWMFDVTNMQWTEILSQNLGKEFYPQPLAGASASLWKKEDEEKKIIIFGGCTEISKYVTNLWIYDIGKL